jgi:hypothetical protein
MEATLNAYLGQIGIEKVGKIMISVVDGKNFVKIANGKSDLSVQSSDVEN